MNHAPSSASSTSRRTIFGRARDVRLSADTINRARRDGWTIYRPAGSDAGLYDCTVYSYGLASDGAPGLISVWDAEE